MMRIVILAVLSLFLVGCGEPDIWDLVEQAEKEEAKRLKNMTEEERKAEEEAEAQRKAEKEAERESRLAQLEWEEEHTDKIHYRISRYSADGVWVVEDKYLLSPMPDTDEKLERHSFSNRGYDPELDKSIIVNSAFLGGVPSGKFDLYEIIWKKDGRAQEDVIRVEVAHEDFSRGW